MRNIDKIKTLQAELSAARRYARNLESAMKVQDHQLVEAQDGSYEMQMAVDGLMVQTAITYGEKVLNQETGAVVGWRLRLPVLDVEKTRGFFLHVIKDPESGDNIFSAVAPFEQRNGTEQGV